MKCEQKKVYITEREAILGLLQVRRIHEVRQRIYKCDECIGWHLTSSLYHWQTEHDFGTEVTKQDWLD